jgi:hypothetical protein
MGKGGEQSNGKGNASTMHFKLEGLATEELRKWAKAYGVADDKERKFLLEQLVLYLI